MDGSAGRSKFDTTMNSNQVAVLDIGSTKAACLAAELDGQGGLKVVGFSSQPCEGVRKGLIADVQEVGDAASTALRHLEADSGLEIESLVVSISCRQGESHLSQGLVPIFPSTRKIHRDDLLQVINHSRQVVMPVGRELVQAIPAEFRVDGRPVKGRPLGEVGARLEVKTFLVSADVEQIGKLESIAEAGGRTIDQFVFEPLASGLGVLTVHQLEHGAVVVDIGGDSTAVGVFRKGSIVDAATIPVGSRHVTSDVATLLKTSPEEAESHKLACGCAIAAIVPESETIGILQLGQIERRPMQRRVFCEIIEARLREIAKLVREALERGGHLDSLPSGVALTGGGSNMKGVVELFDTVLSPLKAKVSTPHLKGHHTAETARPEWAAAAGLARFALECCRDELTPAAKDAKLGDKIRTMLSLLGGKS